MKRTMALMTILLMVLLLLAGCGSDMLNEADSSDLNMEEEETLAKPEDRYNLVEVPGGVKSADPNLITDEVKKAAMERFLSDINLVINAAEANREVELWCAFGSELQIYRSPNATVAVPIIKLLQKAKYTVIPYAPRVGGGYTVSFAREDGSQWRFTVCGSYVEYDYKDTTFVLEDADEIQKLLEELPAKMELKQQ